MEGLGRAAFVTAPGHRAEDEAVALGLGRVVQTLEKVEVEGAHTDVEHDADEP